MNHKSLKIDLIDVKRERAKRSLSYFAKEAWHVIEPGTQYIHGWHVDAISEHLEACTNREIRNLLINMPPRHMKSIMISVFWPVWSWIHKPESRWLFSSYAESLSVRDSVKCRRLIQSPWFQSMFGHIFSLTGDQNEKRRFENDKTGYRLATSVDGSATGEGGDYIVCFSPETRVSTNIGEIEIGKIVEDKIKCLVVSYDHVTNQKELQTISNFEKYTGRLMVRVSFSNGRSFTCTEDHPVYVSKLGYVPAKDLRRSDEVLDVDYLSYLSGRVQNKAIQVNEIKKSAYMQHCLQVKTYARSESSKVQFEKNKMRSVLFSNIKKSIASTSKQFLFEALCIFVSSKGYLWRKKRELLSRHGERQIQGRVLRGKIPRTKERWEKMLSMFKDRWANIGASHRRKPAQQRPVELNYYLSEMPQKGPFERRVFVESVERADTISYVYNLKIEKNHNYFAEGILVHNCDDPHNVQEAESQTMRENTLEWWDYAMSSRGNDPKTFVKVIVMQRVHEGDLSGHVLAQGGYEHLCLPAEYEGSKKITSIGWSDPRKETGELLWPERFGKEELTELKMRLGSRQAAGQLQQRPAAAEGDIIKREWIKRYSVRPEKFDEMILSIDATFTGKATSDFVAIQCWGRIGSNKYFVDQIHRQMGITETIHSLVLMSNRHPTAALKLIENKANGPAIEDLLQNKVSGIVLVEPEGDKVARLNAVSPQFEAGNVFIPEGQVGDDFIEELVTFPNVVHDDRTDACSQALLRLNKAGSVGTIRIIR